MANTSANELSLGDAISPQYLANPYRLYQQLREQDPVYWDQRAGSWLVTSHADAVTALRGARLSAQRFFLDVSWFPEDVQDTLRLPINALMRQILFLDPPDHTRLRSLVSRVFMPRRVEALRAHIQDVVSTLLDSVQGDGQMEVIRQFAYPLPAIVIAEMLGVPPEDRDQFARWTNDFGSLLDGGVSSPEELVASLTGVAEFMHYFQGLIAEHRKSPKDDLMQVLISAEERGDALTEAEILGNCVLLLAAGHGTTTHLIGNGLLSLLQNPAQLRLLRSDLSLMPQAVNEFLRYESPVQATSRLAREDVELAGKHISTGQTVTVCLGAANHDPEVFRDPDRLDIQRQENRQVSFGHGIHFCVGAPLARVEAEVAFTTLLKRFASLELQTPEPEWGASIVFRGLNRLPIAFTSAS